MKKRLRLLALMLGARARAWRFGVRAEAPPDIGGRTPIRTFYPGRLFDPLGIRLGLEPREGIPACGLSPGRRALAPEKLRGRRLTLELDAEASFFGDGLRVVDAPGEKPVLNGAPAFGWTAEPLFGGYILTMSALSGRLELAFEESGDFHGGEPGFLPFTCRFMEPLRGRDGELLSPGGFRLPARENAVFDGDLGSRGWLELATGRLYDFYFSARFRNSAITALESVNPGLEAPSLDFPGLAYAGHNIGLLRQDPMSSAMELSLAAQFFLPLGEGAEDAPLLMPAAGDGEPFPARNSSLHPFIQLRARERVEGLPGARRKRREGEDLQLLFESLQGAVRSLTIAPTSSYFGDIFDLRSPDLDGVARGQSPVFGELRVQFGAIHQGLLPFIIELAPPCSAFRGRYAQALGLLPPGTKPGLLGIRGQLRYGHHRYDQSGLCLMSDAQKLSIGALDISSGEIVEPFIMRHYLFLSLFEELVLTEPRTPTDSFAYSCRGAFSFPGGRLGIEISGETHIPYPEGYRFPLSRGSTRVEPGSYLAPFLRLTALAASEGEHSDLAGLYEVGELRRGVDKGAEILGCRLDTRRRGGTLSFSWGSVETSILRQRVLRREEDDIWLFEAETRSLWRREPVLLALEKGPQPRLVIASGREILDSESLGTFKPAPP